MNLLKYEHRLMNHCSNDLSKVGAWTKKRTLRFLWFLMTVLSVIGPERSDCHMHKCQVIT